MKTSNFSAKNFLPLAAFIIVLLGGLGNLLHDAYKDKLETEEMERANTALISFADLCLKKFPAETETKKFDSLRHCVFVHSVFRDNKKYTPYWEKKDLMADWILGHAKDRKSEPPPMECSFRSWTLIHMLRAMGYQAHDVVTAADQDGFPDHVIARIFNPDTGRWEVHDPSYDTKYYAESKALDIHEMLRMEPDNFYPCDFEGRCGWDKISRENIPFMLAHRYWNTAWIREEEKIYIAAAFDVNKKRKVGNETESFCEQRKKWCKNIVTID